MANGAVTRALRRIELPVLRMTLGLVRKQGNSRAARLSPGGSWAINIGALANQSESSLLRQWSPNRAASVLSANAEVIRRPSALRRVFQKRASGNAKVGSPGVSSLTRKHSSVRVVTQAADSRGHS